MSVLKSTTTATDRFKTIWSAAVLIDYRPSAISDSYWTHHTRDWTLLNHWQAENPSLGLVWPSHDSLRCLKNKWINFVFVYSSPLNGPTRMEVMMKVSFHGGHELEIWDGSDANRHGMNCENWAINQSKRNQIRNSLDFFAATPPQSNRCLNSQGYLRARCENRGRKGHPKENANPSSSPTMLSK